METTQKQLVLGILAHVDSGKTTLSEAMLYRAGAIRKLGRVDHGDAFLDTDTLEKARGITIFSKQAAADGGQYRTSPCWTPPAMWIFPPRRSAPCRCWTMPCWWSAEPMACRAIPKRCGGCCERYHVPTFVFVNKMDLPGMTREAVTGSQLNRRRLSEGFVDFGRMRRCRSQRSAGALR